MRLSRLITGEASGWNVIFEWLQEKFKWCNEDSAERVNSIFDTNNYVSKMQESKDSFNVRINDS